MWGNPVQCVRRSGELLQKKKLNKITKHEKFKAIPGIGKGCNFWVSKNWCNLACSTFWGSFLRTHSSFIIPLATFEKTNWACVLECKKGDMFWTLEEGIMYDNIFWFESAKDFKIYSKMPLTLERPTHIHCLQWLVRMCKLSWFTELRWFRITELSSAKF